jgi:DNA helicase-2/ATP-dependent DNA helicase PcrA
LSGSSDGASEALKSVIKNPDVRKELLRVVDLLASLKKSDSVEPKVRRVNQFYGPFMKKKFDDYPSREEDLKAFVEIASSYQSLEQFLVDFVTLEPPERSTIGLEGKKEDERPVTLSTVHSAKGLEWDVVFILALVDGSIPVSYALDDDEAIEEERRLLYVAVTRARKHLHLSMHNEGRNGGMSSFNRLSRFVSESRVMSKLETDYAWFEDTGLELDDVASPSRSKEDLYRKMVDYYGDADGQDHF